MYELWVKQNDVWDKTEATPAQRMGNGRVTNDSWRTEWQRGAHDVCLTDLEKLPLTWKIRQGRRHSRDRLVPLPSATKSHRLSLFLCFSTCEWRHGEGRHDKELCQAEKHGCSGYRQGSYEPQSPPRFFTPSKWSIFRIRFSLTGVEIKSWSHNRKLRESGVWDLSSRNWLAHLMDKFTHFSRLLINCKMLKAREGGNSTSLPTNGQTANTSLSLYQILFPNFFPNTEERRRQV